MVHFLPSLISKTLTQRLSQCTTGQANGMKEQYICGHFARPFSLVLERGYVLMLNCDKVRKIALSMCDSVQLCMCLICIKVWRSRQMNMNVYFIYERKVRYGLLPCKRMSCNISGRVCEYLLTAIVLSTLHLIHSLSHYSPSTCVEVSVCVKCVRVFY